MDASSPAVSSAPRQGKCLVPSSVLLSPCTFHLWVPTPGQPGAAHAIQMRVEDSNLWSTEAELGTA